MDFRPDDANVGGSDACINYKDEDNKGIAECTQKFGIDTLYGKWASQVSLADYMVIVAEAGIGRTATDNYDVKYDQNNYFRDGTFAKTMRD